MSKPTFGRRFAIVLCAATAGCSGTTKLQPSLLLDRGHAVREEMNARLSMCSTHPLADYARTGICRGLAEPIFFNGGGVPASQVEDVVGIDHAGRHVGRVVVDSTRSDPVTVQDMPLEPGGFACVYRADHSGLSDPPSMLYGGFQVPFPNQNGYFDQKDGPEGLLCYVLDRHLQAPGAAVPGNVVQLVADLHARGGSYKDWFASGVTLDVDETVRSIARGGGLVWRSACTAEGVVRFPDGPYDKHLALVIDGPGPGMGVSEATGRFVIPYQRLPATPGDRVYLSGGQLCSTRFPADACPARDLVCEVDRAQAQLVEALASCETDDRLSQSYSPSSPVMQRADGRSYVAAAIPKDARVRQGWVQVSCRVGDTSVRVEIRGSDNVIGGGIAYGAVDEGGTLDTVLPFASATAAELRCPVDRPRTWNVLVVGALALQEPVVQGCPTFVTEVHSVR